MNAFTKLIIIKNDLKLFLEILKNLQLNYIIKLNYKNYFYVNKNIYIIFKLIFKII